MIKLKVLTVCALCIPLLANYAPAYAASAHNLETGANTKNANDTAADANMKQMHMKKKHHMKKM